MQHLLALGLPADTVAARMPRGRKTQIVTLTVGQKGRAACRIELKGAGARPRIPRARRAAEAANR